MCFRKRRESRISRLEEKIDRLSKAIETQELERLRRESEELKHTMELVSNVKLKVKSVKLIQDQDSSNWSVRVMYEAPTVSLAVNRDGTVEKNKFFYSVNMLEMISYEDMDKIRLILDGIKDKTN